MTHREASLENRLVPSIRAPDCQADLSLSAPALTTMRRIATIWREDFSILRFAISCRMGCHVECPHSWDFDGKVCLRIGGGAMRCPQCGFEAVAGAGFCSRCGNQLLTRHTDARREFALATFTTSWWTFFGTFVAAAVAEVMAAAALRSGQQGRPVALGLFVIGLLIIAMVIVVHRSTSWSLTSERLIERRGFLSQTRLEIELVDIRSVEVSRTFSQRILGIGSVTVSSAASADFLIRMRNVSDPEGIAETIRRARLRRLA
jgi:membrane protein YdbS with pleckstrin-like domain